MCHVHIANQAVAAVRNRSRDCAAFRICVRARRSASNLRIFVRSNGIVRPQGGLSTQNTKTFWHHSSINNSWHEYSLKQCKPPQQRRFSRKMLALPAIWALLAGPSCDHQFQCGFCRPWRNLFAHTGGSRVPRYSAPGGACRKDGEGKRKMGLTRNFAGVRSRGIVTESFRHA
jgi:hypothetical protein